MSADTNALTTLHTLALKKVMAGTVEQLRRFCDDTIAATTDDALMRVCQEWLSGDPQCPQCHGTLYVCTYLAVEGVRGIETPRLVPCPSCICPSCGELKSSGYCTCRNDEVTL